jgi:hypothetical protein
MWPVWVADNSINKQQKFYSPPKRYNKIRRFEQRPFAVNEMKGLCLKGRILLYRSGSE